MLPSGQRWRDPLIAVAAVLSAAALRWSLRPLIGPTDAPLLMFFLAVFVAAWAGGLATGLFATFGSVVLSFAAFFEHPDGLFSLAAPDILSIAVFIIIGIIFSVMSESTVESARTRGGAEPPAARGAGPARRRARPWPPASASSSSEWRITCR